MNRPSFPLDDEIYTEIVVIVSCISEGRRFMDDGSVRKRNGRKKNCEWVFFFFGGGRRAKNEINC